MDLLTIAKIAGGLVGAVGGPAVFLRIFRASFPNKREAARRDIRSNAQLLQLLPVKSAGYSALLGQIDGQVDHLVTDLENVRRDPAGIALAVAFLVSGVALAWPVIAVSSPWRWLILLFALVLLLFGIVGLAESAAQTDRDKTGNAT